jgi:preprotein translocase subunit SecE
MSTIINFFKEVLAEAKHITWPTRKQAIYSTIAVLVISLFVAYYLGALDFLFSRGLEKLLLLR